MARFKMDRAFYTPAEVRGTAPTTFDGADVDYYAYEVNGSHYGVAFVGKAAKPFHYRFATADQRTRWIDQLVIARRSRIASKVEAHAARKAFVHTHKVGDVLYTAWGYEQTRADFYQVTAVKGKMIEVRQIMKDHMDESGNRAVPLPGQFVADAKTLRVLPRANGCKIENHSASAYKGGGVYETPWNMGH